MPGCCSFHVSVCNTLKRKALDCRGSGLVCFFNKTVFHLSSHCLQHLRNYTRLFFLEIKSPKRKKKKKLQRCSQVETKPVSPLRILTNNTDCSAAETVIEVKCERDISDHWLHWTKLGGLLTNPKQIIWSSFLLNLQLFLGVTAVILEQTLDYASSYCEYSLTPCCVNVSAVDQFSNRDSERKRNLYTTDPDLST